MININKYVKLLSLYPNKIYNYNRNTEFTYRASNLKAYAIIKQYFQKALINKPLFMVNNQDKITIYLLYYMPYKSVSSKYNKGPIKRDNHIVSNINGLGNYINKKCYKNLQLELRFVELHYPYLDSYIFAQYIALNSMKYTFNKIRKTLYKRLLLIKYNNSTVYKSSLSNYKSYVTGVKMLINGRLASQRIRPRTAKYITSAGSFKHNSHNSLVDYDINTFKNNMGAFSVKIWISQKLHVN